jgi:hypothetical protein
MFSTYSTVNLLRLSISRHNFTLFCIFPTSIHNREISIFQRIIKKYRARFYARVQLVWANIYKIVFIKYLRRKQFCIIERDSACYKKAPAGGGSCWRTPGMVVNYYHIQLSFTHCQFTDWRLRIKPPTPAYVNCLLRHTILLHTIQYAT